MEHPGLKVYKVCINDDPWLTLTNLIAICQLYEFCFLCFFLAHISISGECLQDHWSPGFICLNGSSIFWILFLDK